MLRSSETQASNSVDLRHIPEPQYPGANFIALNITNQTPPMWLSF